MINNFNIFIDAFAGGGEVGLKEVDQEIVHKKKKL
jgi:hypothetical protein